MGLTTYSTQMCIFNDTLSYGQTVRIGLVALYVVSFLGELHAASDVVAMWERLSMTESEARTQLIQSYLATPWHVMAYCGSYRGYPEHWNNTALISVSSERALFLSILFIDRSGRLKCGFWTWCHSWMALLGRFPSGGIFCQRLTIYHPWWEMWKLWVWSMMGNNSLTLVSQLRLLRTS